MSVLSQEWLVIALGCLVILVLVWVIPPLQLKSLKSLDPDKLFDKENDARKTLGQIIAGLAIVGTLYSTMESLRAAKDQLATAHDQLKVAQETQKTDRFTKAVSELGDPNTVVRIAGLFSLESVGLASSEQSSYWETYEILSAYVREHSKLNSPKSMDSSVETRTDIETAVMLIGRRDPKKDPDDYYISLDHCDLHGIDLQGGDFSNVSFNYSNLQAADFSDAKFDESSSFEGAHLEGVDLTSTKGLNSGNLKLALCDSKTKLPKGTTLQARAIR